MYDPSIIPLLVNVLAIALQTTVGSPGPAAYIALTVRNEETHSDFLRQAGGFSATDPVTVPDLTMPNDHLVESLLSVEDTQTVKVTDNIFTRTAELGQDASSQTVRIFKFRHKP